MEPAKKDEIYKQLKSFLYTIVDNDSYDNVCFTYRTSNKLAGQHYKIALNKNLSEELKTFLLCHEAGHIICRHVATRTTLDYEFAERKIRAVYDRLKPLFDGQDIEEMYDIFEDYIFNMLNDWEVNTKFFTEEEVEYWDSLYPEECCSGGPVHHMLPQECGYPPGLTANEYLLLILQNPELWFQNMATAGMDLLNKDRRHKNGTEGGCNTNQSSASEGSNDANMKNHNKQGRDKNKNKQNQNQNGQSGGNQQNQNGQNGKNQQNGGNQQNGQPQVQQRDGTDAQNQAAANEQHEQNWHDSKQDGSGSGGTQNEQQKDSNKSNGQGGKGSSKEQNDEQNEQSNQNGKGSSKEQNNEQNEQSNQNGKGSSKEQNNEQNEQNGQGGGQGDENSEGAPEDKNQAGGSNSENSDSQEDGQQSGGGASSEDESDDGENSQNAAGNSNNEDENSEDEAMGASDGSEGAEGDSEEKSGSESGDEEGDGTEGDGTEGDGTEGNEQPQLTKEQLEELIDKMIQKMVSDYQRAQEAKMAEAKAKQNDMDAGYSRGSGGGSGIALRDEATNWSDYDGLEKQIRELLVSKCNTTTKRDLLYNYNRGRFSSDVCVPRYRTETTYDEVPMTVLLDVSGSISQSDIVGFCNIFKNVAKTMSKKCTIVLWDEQLRAIFDSNDEVKPLSGGGTDIGRGIKYINDNMNPADIGSLFVVSDCCDDLENWLHSYNGTKYCVCWTNNDIIRRYSGSLYDEWMAEWEKVLVHL